MTLYESEDSIKKGAYAGLFVGVLTGFFVLIALATDGQGRFSEWNDPINLFDVVLIWGLSYGVWRKSRLATVSLFTYYLIARFVIGIQEDGYAGIIISIVMLYAMGRAVYASFAYHRIRRREDSGYRATKRWMKFASVPIGILVFALFAAVLAGSLGPSTAVIPGDELKQADREGLIGEGVVEDGERIVYFYSSGLFSVLEEGNVITDRRVISYEDLGYGLEIESASFSEIESVDLESQGDIWNDTLISVTLLDGSIFYLIASAEAGGDQRFIDELETRVEEANRK